MKKVLALLFIFAFLAFSVFAAVSCGKDNENNGAIYAVYTAYVAYAQENGLMPISYEDWLSTIKGEKGDKGDQGLQGEKGEKGDKGEQGVQGEKGDDGITPTFSVSLDGYWIINDLKTEYKAIGVDGERGDKGDQGIQGKKGDKGEQGKQGEKGDKGDKGEQGIQGEKGDKGDRGEQGIQGEEGNGISSIDLISSANGIDTYSIAFTNGETASFTVTNGKNGEKGQDGISISLIENINGEMIVTLSNGTNYNLGKIIGDNGKDGTSIINAKKENGELILLFDNGQSVNLGNIIGKDGNNAPHYGEIFTVTFDLNGGVCEEEFENSVKVNYGDTLDLFLPERENYIFMGWHTGETANDGKVTAVTPITKDLNLIAKWQAEESFLITYETNGGNGLAPQSFYVNEPITELPSPIKYDRSFAGWYNDEELSDPVAYPIVLTHNKTVYAKWGDSYCKVTFHTNFSVGKDSLNVIAGTQLNEFSIGDYEYHSFIGWYYDSGFKKAVAFPFELHSDIDVYAKWEYIYFNVSFNTNGGNSISAKSFKGGYYVVSEELPEPTKTNYLFDGWYTNATLKNTVVYPYRVVENTTLYAKWIADPYAGYTRISTVAQLNAITNMSGKYLLTSDIDCSRSTIKMIGSTTKPFAGVFDGGGHTLSNISISSSNENIGLFVQNDGTITHLNVIGESIMLTEVTLSKYTFGGIVAINNGNINRCSIVVTFSNSKTMSDSIDINCGGISGLNGGTVTNCFSNCSQNFITPKYGSDVYSGGIVGCNTGYIVNNFSYSSMNLEASYSSGYAGGVAGYNEGGTIENNFVGGFSASAYYYTRVATYYGGNQETNNYKNSIVTYGRGIAATEAQTNSSSFYMGTLGWDSTIWNLTKLNYSQGLYPALW